jgi:hypothetical protein
MTAGVIAIDWKAADVRDGRLRVPLSEGAGKEWVAALERVVERLERTGSGWGTVSATGKGLEVEDVAEGEEASLRHFLESALLQANTAAGDDADGGDDGDEAEDERSDPDRRMTERFRAFADDG